MRVERVPYRLITVATAAVFLAACGKKESAPPPQTPEVGVVTVQPQPVPVVSELPGRTSAYLVAQVRARVDGIVLRREFTEGSDVKAGQRLYKIDPAPYIAQLNSAKATLAKAQANLATQNALVARYKVLVAANAVSKQQYDDAVAAQGQAAAASARAELETAQIKLDYATVTAPIDGRARRAHVTEGALVGQDQATPLTTVEQLDPIYVNFSQSAADVESLRRAVKSGRAAGIAQQDVEVTLVRPDGSTYAREGKLLFADLAVDPSTDTVAMRALFPNPERELLPGAYVRIALDRAVARDAILVPRDALLRTADSATVKVVGQNGKIRDVTVEAAQMKGRDWIVTRGLAGGDRVVVVDAAQFEAGTTVKALERGAAAQPASGAAAASAPGRRST
ncbi:MexX/AxyX family multidrug efflux RND transporter periplasmic adaptor subunit [Burkholderia pseudomallei]|nr:MexX/AxyX family multidrug efflux RND transporter periplasmic adaptor subunit [Burkholderia pseudomallei]